MHSHGLSTRWRPLAARLLLVKSLLVSVDREKNRVVLSTKINESTHASLVTCAISYGARKVAAIFFSYSSSFLGGGRKVLEESFDAKIESRDSRGMV